YSTVKAVFEFEPSTNIGLVFYTALQSVPCFWPSWAEGRSIPCLIPCGIDQDPHFRVTRDIAEGLGYPKPSLLHSQMIPGLLGEAAMSTSGDRPDNALFLNDPPEAVDRRGAAPPRGDPRGLLGLGALAHPLRGVRGEVPRGDGRLPVGRPALRGVQIPGARAGPRVLPTSRRGPGEGQELGRVDDRDGGSESALGAPRIVRRS